ncbi:MAG: Rieske 2Fe-2S domain-containing protein [Chloroflexi bacterium]|nr:Rieske 2Fe-2S domain-containing protein [Chloroflexota bacterium]
MIRTHMSDQGLGRRRLLRGVFLGGVALGAAELVGAVAPYLRVTRVAGLGTTVSVGTRAEILAAFAANDDRPILNYAGRFFLLHAPGGIVAAYRKCTHLGCSVPFNAAEDQFHCVCHQSRYDKRTAVVLGGPAPRPLDLFHVREEAGVLLVDTNPLGAIVRADNVWDTSVLEVRA